LVILWRLHKTVRAPETKVTAPSPGGRSRVAILVVLAACAGQGARAPASSQPDAVVWQYEVTADDAAVDALAVDAHFAPGSSDVLALDDDAAPFVRDVQYEAGSRWLAAGASGSMWTVPCRSAGCRVRYRFNLREAAEKVDDVETAVAAGDVLIAPPATWLLRPAVQPGRFRFHVNVAVPARFVAGTWPSRDHASNTFEASTDALEGSSFAAFGNLHSKVVMRDGARIEVAVAPSGLVLTDDEAVAWVENAVNAIAMYYGRFPVDRTLVIVMAGKAGSPTRGETLGDGGPAVLIRVGSGVTATNVRDDWVITHELFHVTLPTLSHEHIWLSEGMPTYVEPLARARAGLLAPEKLWADLVEGLPQGLPEAGDLGLETTHTWGRTFCLLADVSIRERTANVRSLDDALRAVVATGAHVDVRWDIERLLQVGDQGTGTNVLHELYLRLGLAPGSVDLPALWTSLGVRDRDGRVTFDEAAPLASIRRSMTAAADGAQH
jgi:predicted metalloprotease with PDZ domain